LGHTDLNYLRTATSDRSFDFSTSWTSFSSDGGTVSASLVIGAKNDGGGDMTLSFQFSDLEIIDSPDAPTIAITDDDADDSLSAGDTSTLTFTSQKLPQTSINPTSPYPAVRSPTSPVPVPPTPQPSRQPPKAPPMASSQLPPPHSPMQPATSTTTVLMQITPSH
tara:strand:+ start:5167 stop:5661 length:495 start_codon:yes stop_codon:yes gene_type:complete